MISKAILDAVKQGDNNAFKVLYNNCIAYVYTITKRYISNKNDIPDVIQEIFARVFLSIKNFDESKGEFKYWLRRLSINQCLLHYRKRKSTGIVLSIESVNEIEIGFEEQLHELSKEEVEQFLQKMPEGYRQVFMLVIIDEYSHKEVSDLLKISVETSRSQLHRAKKWLQNKLSNNNFKILASGF